MSKLSWKQCKNPAYLSYGVGTAKVCVGPWPSTYPGGKFVAYWHAKGILDGRIAICDTLEQAQAKALEARER
jgi:hypothetical protein